MKKTILIFMFITALYSFNFSKDTTVPYTLEDRDRIIRIETTLQQFMQNTDKRFEQVDKRFEQVITFIGILSGIFTALTIGVFGFAYWDRRSFVKPFEEKTEKIAARMNNQDIKIEETVNINKKLIEAIIKLSPKSKELEDLLKHANLI